MSDAFASTGQEEKRQGDCALDESQPFPFPKESKSLHHLSLNDLNRLEARKRHRKASHSIEVSSSQGTA